MQLKEGNSRMHVKVHPLSAVFWMGILVLDHSAVIGISLLCALLHECGHLIAMRLCRIGVVCVTVYPMGLDIKRKEGICSYRSDFLIYGAGIFMNLLCAGLGVLACAILGEGRAVAELWIAANLFLGGVNLFPHPCLDGGGMLRSFLLCHFSPECAEKAARGVGDGVTVILLCGVLYLMFYAKGNPSVYLFCAYLAFSLVDRKNGG